MSGRYDFVIKQGATFSRVITFRNPDGSLLNLTNYTATLTIYNRIDGSIVDTLTTANGKLTLGGTAGTVTILLSYSVTDAYDFDKGVWELDFTNGSQKERPLEGVCTLARKGTF